MQSAKRATKAMQPVNNITSDEHRSKGLRKGTHSCTECRRRKKSCIPHPNKPGVCTECLSRGSQCREQERSPAQSSQKSKQNLQRRVTELETALLGISDKLGTTLTPTNVENQDGAAGTLTQLRADLLPPTPASLVSVSSPHDCSDSAPVLSLFNNAILNRRPESEDPPVGSAHSLLYDSGESSVGGANLENTRQTLLALFPTQQRLEVILAASQDWWTAYQYIFPDIFGPSPDSSIHDYVRESMSSGSAQRISKALLCVTIGLQEEPAMFDVDYNVASTQRNIERYLTAIEDLVLSKDHLAGTIDGIECLMLQAKHDSNNGLVRRAWVTFRRAISFAQLQGLHVQAKIGYSKDSLRKRSLWKALYQGDRYLSLLLGLPYSVAELRYDPTCEMGTYTTDSDLKSSAHNYFFNLANIVGHVIDRNQEASANDALTVTVKIEGDLIDLASTMISEWWALDPPNPENAIYELYTRLVPQFWHHQTRTLLHLPFMLKAFTERRYEFNKVAALESARGMLEIYRIIRPAAGFASLVCKVVDFQAFTAAMVLVLNMLGLSQTSPSIDLREIDADRALLCTTTGILQRSSLETGGQVATQAARALEMFADYRSLQGTSKVAVPYFGTVTFGLGKSFAHNNGLKTRKCSQQPMQVPSPNEESLGPSPQPQGQWSVQNNFASMPSDLNFAPIPTQQAQDFVIDENLFANVNFDIDQDWSWFWNNTEVL